MTRSRLSRSPVRGFTLIELLVVITIIGMLMGLLIPAANAVRESMRRTSCESNMRQVGQAILQTTSTSTSQRFPGYRESTSYNPSNNKQIIIYNWMVKILPALQQDKTYQLFRSGTPPATIPYVEIFVCPSDPPENNTVPAYDYIVNTGRPDNKYLPKAANGLFFDEVGGAGIIMTKAKIYDGDENTLMVSENSNTAKLYNQTSGWGESQITTTGTASTAVTQTKVGFTWYDTYTDSPYRRINGGRVPDPSIPAAKSTDDYARPASNHSGGVNACFASGTCRWLREDIEYYVYQQLMTSDGANAGKIATTDYKDPNNTGSNVYNLSEADWK